MKKYKFRALEFYSIEQKCNCCNSELILKKHYSLKNGEYYEIVKCKNTECETNNIGVKKMFILKSFVPDTIYKEEIKKRRKHNIKCVEYYIEKGYSEEKANIIISNMNSIYSKLVKIRKGKSKIELRKKGYSEDQIADICLAPSNINFWIKKGFSEEDAIIKVVENQSYASKHVDYKKRITNVHINYYINKGFSEEDAKNELKNRQNTFTLDKCIDKYGSDKGLDVYNNRQRKWVEKMNIMYKNGEFSKTSSNNYSKLELTFIKDIINMCELKDNEYFSNLTKPFYIRSKELNITLSYDFVLKNKVIEFNGDYWHCNPNKYDKTYLHPHKKITAEEIWIFDKIKNNIIKDKGYDLLVIWEDDYKNNKENILNECKIFLTK